MQQRVDTVEDMLGLGYTIGKEWKGLGMLALIGPMGVGKTHFSKGFARGLGAQDDVSSPTFSLIHEYRSGRAPIFHFDWYRMKSANEILDLGWDEYADTGILLVEWADLFPEIWLDQVFTIEFFVTDQGRNVEINDS